MAWTAAAQATPIDVSGYVAAEVRIFPAEAKFARQHVNAFSPSMALQPEMRWKPDDETTLTIIAFGRVDADDSERTHWDIREANWLYNAGDWDLRIGLGKVFWGVAESRHLVDIINQSDLVESLDEEDKLDEALCLADTNEDGENLLIDDDLARWLEDIPARQITVILDCCHAGTGTKAPDDDVVPRFLPLSVATNAIMLPKPAWRELRDMTKGGARHLTAFFACRSDQQAYERRFPIGKVPAKGGQAPAKAGQFTQALLAGLRDSAADANKDGTITNQELLRFSVERLDDSFNRNRSRPAERQEPLLETENANTPVFGRSGGR